MEKCIICGLPKQSIKTGDTITDVYNSILPCKECYEKYLKDGVLVIEAKKVLRGDGEVLPLVTGDILVLKDDFFRKIIDKTIPEERIALVDPGSNQRIREVLKTLEEEAKPLVKYTFEEYQDLCHRTVKDKMLIEDILFGIIGESGELIDLLKKIFFHKHDFNLETRIKLIKELGDLNWYLAVYIAKTGIPFEGSEVHFALNETLGIAPLKEYLPEEIEQALINNCLGIPGEINELVELYKTNSTDGGTIAKVCDSLGYIYTTIGGICSFFNFTIEEIWFKNIEKLKKRYPEQYTNADSEGRKE